MQRSHLKTLRSLLPVIVLALAATATARAQGNDNRDPEVPESIDVPAGHKVLFHTYAVGVQIYQWNGTAWVFQAPDATLYDADGNIVGIHYAGPTWESNSRSKVVGVRIAGAPSPNPNSIPMLLLEAHLTQGPGIFARTTYIQRVNTVGGVAPTAPGTTVGEEARVPYTAEYFFYRQQ